MAAFTLTQRTLYTVALELDKQEILELRELFATVPEKFPKELGDAMLRAFTIPATTIKEI